MQIGFPGALFIVFLILKLTEVIDWSWWWVTCPLWAGLVLVFAAACGVGAVAGGVAAVQTLKEKKK